MPEATRARTARVPTKTAFLWLAALVLHPGSALGQNSQPDCCSRFEYRLEKTIFKVDAVRLEMDVRDSAADRVADLVDAWSRSKSLEDSVAALYLGSADVDVRMTFLISASLGRFLGGTRSTMESLAETGLLSREEADDLYAAYVERYSVLEGRGIKDGDVMVRTLRGDTLSMLYTAVTGEVLIDDVVVGPERRRGFLGAFFGPKADFRRGLIDQVFERAGK